MSFGEVFELPTGAGRYGVGAALASARPEARTNLSLAQLGPEPLPLQVHRMERHEFSSQTFIPLAPIRFLVIVAPHAAGGGPDMLRAEAFVAAPGQGITYRADVWHHPMAVLDLPGRFAILMWADGSTGDEEFVAVTPFTVDLP